jgi:hypothetical protein
VGLARPGHAGPGRRDRHYPREARVVVVADATQGLQVLWQLVLKGRVVAQRKLHTGSQGPGPGGASVVFWGWGWGSGAQWVGDTESRHQGNAHNSIRGASHAYRSAQQIVGRRQYETTACGVDTSRESAGAGAGGQRT